MRNYDHRAFEDPLVPPLKRDDWNIPIIPIPTRGGPTNYKKVGTLINNAADNNDKYKFLFLMGRQKYPGADYYDYYAVEKDSHGPGILKFNIPNLRKEVYTGDTITISELNTDYN